MKRIIVAFKASQLTDEKGNPTDLLRRTLFCVSPDYYMYWGSGWLYLKQCKKYRLITNKKDLQDFVYQYGGVGKKHFKKLLEQLIDNNPKNIIEKYITNHKDDISWQKRLVINEKLLAQSNAKYIAIKEQTKEYWVLKTQKPNRDELLIPILLE